MRLVQVKHMVGGGQHHLVPFGEDNGLKHVYRFRQVGHDHPGGMPVEDVQRQRRHLRIPQGALLIQEARMIVPGSTSYQAPHSSTISPTRPLGSWRFMNLLHGR